jgi:hypothetical protein
MAKKRMLADVLWEAANVHLSANDENTLDSSRYSCEALAHAIYGEHRYDLDWDEDICRSMSMRFISSLGCDLQATNLFGRFRQGPKRQGVRYMWLLLAMHVAEDEGIEL